jgi:myo-inositol-1(or 4)-monophosphatase
MLAHLRAMFAEVRTFLLGEGCGKLGVVQCNARGDVTKEFDYLAEERIIEYCRRQIPEPVRILTEERGEVRTGAGAAAWTLIVDPVDGSENFSRGNELSCVSLAACPGPDDPRPDGVAASLIGKIYTGTTIEAVRDAGATLNGQPVRRSGVTRLPDALVAMDLATLGPRRVRRIQGLLAAVRDVRRFGSAAAELASVATGGADAYVDARDTLSPENYMAAVLILREAGAVLTDRLGGPLAPIRSMTQGQSLVAACTPELHQAILAALEPDPL